MNLAQSNKSEKIFKKVRETEFQENWIKKGKVKLHYKQFRHNYKRFPVQT